LRDFAKKIVDGYFDSSSGQKLILTAVVIDLGTADIPPRLIDLINCFEKI